MFIKNTGMDDKILGLIERLSICQAKCNYCFNACLKEEDVKMMVRCIKLDKECAEICSITLSQIASDSEFKREILQLCAKACEECANECKKHSYPHCQKCAAACEECAEACRNFI